MHNYWRDMALLAVAQIRQGVEMGAITYKQANKALSAVIDAAKLKAANDKRVKDKDDEH